MNHPLQFLRLFGFAEGVSYLILLLIAMPLKYAAGMPTAVQVVGMAHGVLFVLYVLAAFATAWACRWSLLRLAVTLLASLIPVGTFLLEPRWRAEAERIADNQPAGRPGQA